MKVTLTGTRKDEPLTLTWTNGSIDGPASAVRLLEVEADVYRRDPLHMPGAGLVSRGDHLATAWGFVAVAQVLFDTEPTIGGDPLPDREPSHPEAVQ